MIKYVLIISTILFFNSVKKPNNSNDTPVETSGKDSIELSWQGAMGPAIETDETWMGIERLSIFHGRGDFAFDITDQKRDDVKPVIGKFSGEKRSYDFADEHWPAPKPCRIRTVPAKTLDEDMKDLVQQQTRQNKNRVNRNQTIEPIHPKDNLFKSIDLAIKGNYDLIFLMPQITPKSRRAEQLLTNDGKYYKDMVYEAVKTFNGEKLKDAPIELIWEIGNEVNSSPRFSLRDLNNGVAVFGHPEHAKDYVEYYLAPSVEAIRQASKDIFGDERRVKIIMGSVSSILKDPQQEFLNILLDYEIKGINAPTLAGKKGYELIDAITVHYTNGQEWIWEKIYDKWVGSGKVYGLWTTEELGRRGRGDYTVALVGLRYLDFWTKHNWDPMRSRLDYWGINMNHPECATKGIDAAKLLGGFLRNYPLTNVKNKEILVTTGADVEWKAFRADTPSGETRYTVGIRPYMESQSALRLLKINKPEIKDKNVYVDIYVMHKNKATEIIQSPPILKGKEGFELQFNNWELDPTSLVVAFITVH